MSKNLTRKGLALGAIVALASTVIAGSPAFAAGEVIFAPTTGTSYNTFVTEGLTLNASLAPNQVAGNIAQLKYNVTVPTGATLEYSVNGAMTATPLAATGTISGAGDVSAANTLKVSVKYTTVETPPVATSASVSVAVIAFIDSNNDNVVDAGEFQQSRTLGFKKYSEVLPTVTLTQPNVGDLSVKATATLADINAEQTAANTKVVFTATGQALTTIGVSASAGVYSDAATPPAALAATNVVTARATFKGEALGTAAVSATVSARTINTVNGLVSNVSAGNDSVKTAATVIATDTAATVRTNGSYTVQVKATDISAGAAVASTVAKAGVAVVATIATTAGLVATAGAVVSITANGVTYNTPAALAAASIALTTDAAGLANVTIATAGFDDGKTVTVTFKSQNLTSAVVATADDTTYTVKSTSPFVSLERSIVEGGSTTLTYAVKDQFGVALAAPSRLKFVVGYGVTTATASATTYVPLVGGSASITVTDTTASTVTPITVAAGLQIQDATSLNYLPETPAVSAEAHNVNVTATAAAFNAGAGTPSATFGAVAVDTAVSLGSALAINNAGGLVTIAGTGVTFTVNSVDYANTVTVITGVGGALPAVTAKSTTAGAKNITFTVGTNVTTSVLTVSPAVQTSGTVLTLDAPATILPGRTLVVTGKLVDKFGNGVNTTLTGVATFDVVYTGPGLIVGDLPTDTDAAGAFSFRVLLGANETGSASVSATYDADGATVVSGGVTTGAGVAITAAKTVTIGAAAVVAPKAAVIATKNGRVYVTVNSPAGFKSYVKVGFSVKPAFTTTGSKLVSYFVGSGKRVAVVVFVRGGKVASQAITIK